MVKKKPKKKQQKSSAEHGGVPFTHETSPRGRPKTRAFREAVIAWGLRPVPTDEHGQPQFVHVRKKKDGSPYQVNSLFAEIKKRGGRINCFDVAAMQLWRRAAGNGDMDALKMISDTVDGTPVSTLHMGQIDGSGNVVDPTESAGITEALGALLAELATAKTAGVRYEAKVAETSAETPSNS